MEESSLPERLVHPALLVSWSRCHPKGPQGTTVWCCPATAVKTSGGHLLSPVNDSFGMDLRVGDSIRKRPYKAASMF